MIERSFSAAQKRHLIKQILCDNEIDNTNSEAKDCKTMIQQVQTTQRAMLKAPRRRRRRRAQPALFALVGVVALFILFATIPATSGQSASHLLFRRQSSSSFADEANAEEVSATTTAQPTTTTTTTTDSIRVEPLLATEVNAATTSTTANPPPTSEPDAGERTKPTRVPPVNFTQVNELFEAAFDESEVVAKWRHMDKQLSDGE